MARELTEKQLGFVDAFTAQAVECHANSVAHGWYDPPPSDAERIALMHSELSEALEAMRVGGGESEKIPQYSHVEEELADVIIRIMDFSASKKLNVAGAIVAKHEYNKGRPYKHGNKKF